MNGESDFYRLTQALQRARVVDLTHSFFPGQPHHPALPDQQRRSVIDFDSGYSSLVQEFRLVGQWGTHIDPPLHCHPSGLALDELSVEECLLPLVVLDIHERVRSDPDTTALMEDLRSWEATHGQIPPRAFVALRTDWSLRWPDNEAMENRGKDGFSHRPGWSMEVLRFLVEERCVTAIGHETSDTDTGIAVSAKGDYSLERYFLGTGRWQVELIANLRDVPDAGALIFVGWPKPKGGSGFPVRAVALCAPNEDRATPEPRVATRP
jgi:kynurenine formamidase